MPTKVFPGRLDQLEKISDFVVQAAHKAGLDDGAVYAVQLAVDEAATNIIEHGYKGANGEIRCACKTLADGLEVQLVDQAPTFDPGNVADPKIGAPLEEVRSRGLGLFLMRKVMDEVVFETKPGYGNVLTMIKRK